MHAFEFLIMFLMVAFLGLFDELWIAREKLEQARRQLELKEEALSRERKERDATQRPEGNDHTHIGSDYDTPRAQSTVMQNDAHSSPSRIQTR